MFSMLQLSSYNKKHGICDLGMHLLGGENLLSDSVRDSSCLCLATRSQVPETVEKPALLHSQFEHFSGSESCSGHLRSAQSIELWAETRCDHHDPPSAFASIRQTFQNRMHKIPRHEKGVQDMRSSRPKPRVRKENIRWPPPRSPLCAACPCH